jgi:hypothetical protein
MVGVPFLLTMCVAGPSSRIGWPWLCLLRSQRISPPPIRKLSTSAVRNAAIERKVR